ncbi:hypothetical protein KAJ27_08925, partial [bacterium]|nr:hypothetical protein [bacterium]
YSDAKGDDKGGGNLRYPLANIFVPNAFDLKKFKIYDEGNYYEFSIELWGQIITAPHGSKSSDFSYKGRSGERNERFGVGPNGWIYQMMDIYINFGNHKHKNALPGRNISFFENNYWDKVILITPENPVVLKNLIQENTETPGLQEMSDDVILPYYYRVKGNRFIARVYKNRLPKITGEIGFQVFMMGYNSSFDRPSTLKTIPVEASPTYKTFGGEFSYCEGQPFIVDMLCPPIESQFNLLSNYSCSTHPGKKLFAKVPMIWTRVKK